MSYLREETTLYCRNRCANKNCARHYTRMYDTNGECEQQYLRDSEYCEGYKKPRPRGGKQNAESIIKHR